MQSNPVEQGQIRRAVDRHGSRIFVNGVSKSYGARTVLRDCTAHIEAGEFVAIVGRSGCGKSTLLRLLAGLEHSSRGSVEFGDAESPPEIRMMFQDARLLPWKTVLDNVALGVAPRTGRVAAISDALHQVGLASRASDWPAVLSGGQRQRVALARALLHAPDILLLDEPLGALDALTRIEMQQLIETIWQERGFTAVLVTHDVQEALALADRILLIEDGCIALDVAVPLARPRRRGTAEFAKLEREILAHLLQHPVPPAPTQQVSCVDAETGSDGHPHYGDMSEIGYVS